MQLMSPVDSKVRLISTEDITVVISSKIALYKLLSPDDGMMKLLFSDNQIVA